MKQKFLFLLLSLFMVSATLDTAYARPKRPKSCARKVLLPGQTKAVKCTKARKMKNNYF